MESTGVLLRALGAGKLNATLIEMYGESALQFQLQRYNNLLLRMEKYGNDPRCVVVSTPGRTELGGNHTDHNNGVVLAAGIHFDCLAVATPTDSSLVHLRSEGFSAEIEVDLAELDMKSGEEGTSTALVRGVLAGFQSRGWPIGGFDACVAGDVPMGAGLSSSAAFEVCVGQILNQLFNDGARTPLELAEVGREAENTYFGKPCGFMDQIACAAQGILSIDFETPERPQVKEVDFDFAETDYQLMVVDTGGSHADLTSEYAAITVEMGQAAQVLGREKARGLTLEQVMDAAPEIRREAGDRALLRLIHFVEENKRAERQAAALKAGDMRFFLHLVKQSGDSSWRLLQNCVSTKRFLEQGIPVALTLTERFLEGEGAWRMQGGGFAGTIQAYVPKSRVGAYMAYMENVFGRRSVLPLRIRKPGHERLRLYADSARYPGQQ
ncbi:galactokinase [Pseudodesulfovibrio sediminis]|uniref:Galactokinase n=1 Tax=Pseudodesulfovibrio sediminis TaxID=2810563 RepID=A0ABM7P9D7_9BACT|nr:galactokinase family protein [Pseudodesulfovibrio sediminis]BCS89605.1 galactokinase [Pseudodesulfovibrio sediminis]